VEEQKYSIEVPQNLVLQEKIVGSQGSNHSRRRGTHKLIFNSKGSSIYHKMSIPKNDMSFHQDEIRDNPNSKPRTPWELFLYALKK